MEMPDELKYENGFQWNADASSIINALNDGRLYFLYRGHGFADGWGLLGNEYAQFNSQHIASLTNIESMPLVFSITCDTGDHSKDNNFIRNLLSSPQGGTYAAFAQTSTGESGINDLLTSFFINCVWPTPGLEIERYPAYIFWQNNPMIYQSLPALRLGQMLDISINGTADSFGLDNSEESTGLYLKRITHCFGDPSILFRKKMPSLLSNVNVYRNHENNTVRVGIPSIGTNYYISFYDKTTDDSMMYRGNSATYTASQTGGERYVDVYVYNSESIPFFAQGENYEGYVTQEDQSRLIRHSLHTNGKYMEVVYYLSEAHKGRNMGIIAFDLQTNEIIYNSRIDSSLVGSEASVPVYVNNGLMTISLTVDGMPISNMKVFVPQN